MTKSTEPETAELLFSELDLPENVRRGVEDAGFVKCTPIQAETLPLALSGHDVAGQAQTGTGKTAAFLLAIFTILDRQERRYKGKGCCPRALIVAPTRELAMQIQAEADLLGVHTGLGIHAVYGGVDYDKQRERFAENVDVLIGTPGRLIDYFEQRVYTLEDTEIFVADEADRMFDMGFIDDLRFLVRRMPAAAERTSFLYSATLSHRVLELAYEHMKSNDVKRVTIAAEQITAENIEQHMYHVGNDQKFPLLLGLLKKEEPSRALIFVNTRMGASMIADRLVHEGYVAGALIGDLPQKKRTKMLEEFKAGNLAIMVATDVASRGLHIDDVTHVFNYDLPQDPEDYVHRIGRTARAGASGRALSIACERYVYSLEAIHEYTGFEIPAEFPGEDMMVKPKFYRRPPRDDSRGRDGRGGKGGGRGGDSRSGGWRPASSGPKAVSTGIMWDKPKTDGDAAPAAKGEGKDAAPGSDQPSNS